MINTHLMTCRIEGQTYMIPDRLMAAFCRGGKRTIREGIQHWHEQAEAERHEQMRLSSTAADAGLMAWSQDSPRDTIGGI